MGIVERTTDLTIDEAMKRYQFIEFILYCHTLTFQFMRVAFKTSMVILAIYWYPLSLMSIGLYFMFVSLFLVSRKYKFKRPQEDKEWIIKCFEYILNSQQLRRVQN